MIVNLKRYERISNEDREKDTARWAINGTDHPIALGIFRQFENNPWERPIQPHRIGFENEILRPKE